MDNTKATDLFENTPAAQAVLKNALPAMAAMLLVLIYNLADTFFIGQTHDALQVAAVSLAMPVFLIFIAVGTVFGVGGTSAISRALGEGRTEYAKKVCSFCMWGCVAVSVVMTALFLVFMDGILSFAGASPDTWDYAGTYLSIVTLSGPFLAVSNCYSNIIRAEGRSGVAMAGQVVGNLLNIILDPILILGFGWEITGAAVATVIGNVAGALCYILYFARGKSTLSISLRDFTIKEGVCAAVLAIGVPAALGSLLMSVSQIIVNTQLTRCDDMAVAGMGVASKIVTITGMVCMGLGQGVQPLLGYCVGAKLWERFRKVLRFSLIFSLVLGAALTAVCYMGVDSIAGAFLTDEGAYSYAVDFSCILLTTSALFGVFYVFMNALQATGAAAPALLINLSRQGIIFIPAVFLLQEIMGTTGIVWAQPVADILSTALAIFLYIQVVHKLTGRSSLAEKISEASAFRTSDAMSSSSAGS